MAPSTVPPIAPRGRTCRSPGSAVADTAEQHAARPTTRAEDEQVNAAMQVAAEAEQRDQA